MENWDSFAFMELIAMIDKKFGVAVEFEELEKCKTLEDLCTLLNGHIDC